MLLFLLSATNRKNFISPRRSQKNSSKVEEIEDKIDKQYVNMKRQLVTHESKMDPGAAIIFDDLIEFIEQAADMCADTVDYIIILSSKE
jgi:uncharacterized protein Yka (UPF0111/DUF47 family)